MSADGNDGIGLSTPTPTSRAWRPSEESVVIVAAVIGQLATAIELLVLEKRYVTGRSKAGDGVFASLILMLRPRTILTAVDRVVRPIISSLDGWVGHQPSRKESHTGLAIQAHHWFAGV